MTPRYLAAALALIVVATLASESDGFEFSVQTVEATTTIPPSTVAHRDADGRPYVAYVVPDPEFPAGYGSTRFAERSDAGTWDVRKGPIARLLPGSIARLRYNQKAIGVMPTYVVSDGTKAGLWIRGSTGWNPLEGLVWGSSNLISSVSASREIGTGAVCLAFTTDDGKLRFARALPTADFVDVVVATNAEPQISLALDASGLARIAYRDATSGRIVYAQEIPGSPTWHLQTVSPDDGETPSLVLDSQNLPRIAYRSAQGLMYSEGSGIAGGTLTWNAELALSGSWAGFSPDLALTGEEFPWIASCETASGSVLLTQRLGGPGESWQSTYVAKYLGQPSGTSLWIRRAGDPKISFYSEGAGNQGRVDFADAGVWVARIQDQGVGGQTFQVAWGGAGPVVVETSVDGGASYQAMTETNESPAFFTLPAVQAEAVRVRITRPSDGATSISSNTFRIVPRTTPPNPVSQARWTSPGTGTEWRGYAVANAGDFNGDGYGDLVAGAPMSGALGAFTGRAYVFFGGPTSDATADLVLTGPEAGAQLGNSVAGIGDVNRDGYADIAVGAPYTTSPGGAGKVFVYYGGPSPNAVADEILQGLPGDRFGASVAGLGDVNGDGYDDLAAGAPDHAAAMGLWAQAGRVDLFFGGPVFDATADRSIEGAAAGDEFGYSLAGGGDVNGDGWGDFVVGARFADGPAAGEAGRVYLFLGGPQLDSFADAQQTGTTASAQLGYAVAIVGDVNGDGLAEIAAGAPYEQNERGRGFLWGGSRTWSQSDPASMDPDFGPPGMPRSTLDEHMGSPNLTLSGEGDGDLFGYAVAGTGDLNGDCYADVIFGAPGWGALHGRVHYLLGGTAPEPRAGAFLEGSVAGEGIGLSVAVLSAGRPGVPAALALGGYQPAGGIAQDGLVAFHEFARHLLASSPTGTTWPVGARRDVRWLGSEPADLQLSIDGGATWTTLLSGVGGTPINTATIRVPHTPTKFARIRMMPPSPILPPSPVVPPSPIVPTGPNTPPNPIVCTPEAWMAVSDSFFTIQTSVSLLALLAAPAPAGSGAVITWNSDPGPDDLAGYRLERASGNAAWSTIAPLVRETSFTDPDAGPATRYRLFAVNGLNEELLLGETSFRPRAPLAAWPLPFRGGEMSVFFATHGGWGGGAGRSEVSLFDVRGRLVRKIADGEYAAGYQTVRWDGRDDAGRRVAAGIYFLRSKSAGEERTMKVVVAR